MEQDYTQAFNWIEKAAEQGDAEAQYTLGTLYHNGQGVEKNPKEAFNWYQKAANQWHTEAIDQLDRLILEM